MKAKTARSSLVTIAVLAVTAVAVNSAPAGAPMTFQKYPDAFGGPLGPGVHAKPLDRVPAARGFELRTVPCSAKAPGTVCFAVAR